LLTITEKLLLPIECQGFTRRRYLVEAGISFPKTENYPALPPNAPEYHFPGAWGYDLNGILSVWDVFMAYPLLSNNFVTMLLLSHDLMSPPPSGSE